MLPNNISGEIDHSSLIAARHNWQEKLATQKGRVSREKFGIGDKVVIQNPATRKWTIIGTNESKREAEDGNNQSFIIILDQGGEALKNKRYIKHTF